MTLIVNWSCNCKCLSLISKKWDTGNAERRESERQQDKKRNVVHCLTVSGKPKHFFTRRPKFFASMHLKPPVSKSFMKKNIVKCLRNVSPHDQCVSEDAAHTVPQMLVSVSAGCQVIFSHRSCWWEEKHWCYCMLWNKPITIMQVDYEYYMRSTAHNGTSK